MVPRPHHGEILGFRSGMGLPINARNGTLRQENRNGKHTEIFSMSKHMVFFMLSIILSSTVFAEGDAATGKTKAGICVACHGANGISPADIWPNLAGQKNAYLVKQIKAFRDGDRSDASMDPMVKSLSDQDIEDIAAYFSSMGCK